MPRLSRWVLGAAGVSAVLAGLTAYSRRQVRRGEAEFPPHGRILDLPSGGSLHVVEQGSGTPVVFIHGADGVALSFTETVTAEVARDHRTIAVDRPGHGYSTRPPGGTDVRTNVEAIREGMRQLGVERPIVLGQSYGGFTALAWAVDHPEDMRALVLVAPVAAFPWRLPDQLLRLVALPVVGRVLTDALVEPIGSAALGPLERNAFDPRPVPERYAEYAHALYLRPSQFRALASELSNLRADVAEYAPRFGEIDMPVEIVAAEFDRVTEPRFHARPLAQQVRGANLTELPGEGHELNWARPGALVDAIRRAEARSS